MFHDPIFFPQLTLHIYTYKSGYVIFSKVLKKILPYFSKGLFETLLSHKSNLVTEITFGPSKMKVSALKVFCTRQIFLDKSTFNSFKKRTAIFVRFSFDFKRHNVDLPQCGSFKTLNHSKQMRKTSPKVLQMPQC